MKFHKVLSVECGTFSIELSRRCLAVASQWVPYLSLSRLGAEEAKVNLA